jgi:hypothetical protein
MPGVFHVTVLAIWICITCLLHSCSVLATASQNWVEYAALNLQDCYAALPSSHQLLMDVATHADPSP